MRCFKLGFKIYVVVTCLEGNTAINKILDLFMAVVSNTEKNVDDYESRFYLPLWLREAASRRRQSQSGLWCPKGQTRPSASKSSGRNRFFLNPRIAPGL
jgi:hypothetical protein